MIIFLCIHLNRQKSDLFSFKEVFWSISEIFPAFSWKRYQLPAKFDTSLYDIAHPSLDLVTSCVPRHRSGVRERTVDRLLGIKGKFSF